MFLGDYVDRGPDANGVVSRLIELSRRQDCTFLHGQPRVDVPRLPGLARLGLLRRRRVPDERRRPHARELRLLRPQQVRPGDLRAAARARELLRAARAGYQRGRLPVRARGPRPSGVCRSGDAAYALRVSRAEDLLWNRTTAEHPHKLGVTVVYGHTPRQTSGCAGTSRSASASTPAPSTAARSPRSACPTSASSRLIRPAAIDRIANGRGLAHSTTAFPADISRKALEGESRLARYEPHRHRLHPPRECSFPVASTSRCT